MEAATSFTRVVLGCSIGMPNSLRRIVFLMEYLRNRRFPHRHHICILPCTHVLELVYRLPAKADVHQIIWCSPAVKVHSLTKSCLCCFDLWNRRGLRYSHIPLCLLYSSLTKLFLLLLLSVWGPSSTPEDVPSTAYQYTFSFTDPVLQKMWGALDDDKLDREWVVRNVLGGMSAGFGLRGKEY